MGRDVDYRDQGVAQFFEARANGVNKIGLRAPATVASDIDIELLATLPVSTQVLTISSTGQIGTTAIGAGDLDDSYDFPTAGAGRVITADSGAVEVNVPGGGGNVGLLVTNADNFDVLQVTKSASGAGVALNITNAGTGIGLRVDQNGDAVGLDVDIDASSTSTGLSVVNAGTGVGLLVTQNGVMDAAQFIQSQNDNGVFIQKTGVGAGDALLVQNLGTGITISVDADGDAIGVNIDAAVASTKAGLNVLHAGTGSAGVFTQSGIAIALSVVQNAVAVAAQVAQTQNAVGIQINKTGAGGGSALSIDNDGTGSAIFLTQDGNATSAIDINVTNANTTGVDITIVAGTGRGILITNPGTGDGINVQQNGEGVAGEFVKSATGGTQAVIIQQLGTGPALFINADGNAEGIQIDSEATGSPLIELLPVVGNARGDISFGSARTSDASAPSTGDLFFNFTAKRFKIELGAAGPTPMATVFGAYAGLEEAFTLVTDAFTLINAGRARVAAESGVTDDLSTISSGAPAFETGDTVMLEADAGDTITVKHNVGNIRLDANADKTLVNRNRLWLMFDGTDWVQVSSLITMA